ncbi:MAG TPA: hypothetical protein DCR14_11775, partial [Acidimicrobiaceae bacterium]|nr:hypothetical protein [Acidimicrobiaceae bacterium]
MTAADITVRVVVVNFDGGAVTLRCLDSLLASDHAHLLDIVVVDNASVDGLLWTLQERYPQVRLIVSDVNEGFARGCNLALRDLDGVDFVALINNDAIVHPGWLAPLLAASEPADVGAVCPKLLLNIDVNAVLIDAAPTGRLPDGRDVGIGVSAVRIDQRDVTYEVRYDERFWADERAFRNDNGVKWTKQPTASLWWPVEPDQSPSVVDVRLTAVAPTTVRVGTGDGQMREVEVTPAGTSVTLHPHEVLRVVNSAG